MIIIPLLLYSCIAALGVYLLFKLQTRHPNRFPPGPTPWPLIGNLPHLSPVPHQSLAALAKKYGPLMHLRLGSVDVVVATSSSVAAQFLKVHDVNFASRPPSSGAKHIAYDYQDLVFAPYGPRWRMLRKICSVHIFSSKALDDYHHVRQEEVAILTRALFNAGESPVNLGQLLNICTINALSRVMLGRRVFGSDADKKANEFKDMVLELMVLAGEFNLGDFIPALDWLDLQGVVKKMKKLHGRFDSFLSSILEEHKRDNHNGSGHSDLLSTLISLKDDVDEEGEKISDVQIKALLLNLFAAGIPTTTSTVEWVIAELIRHPQLMKQAREEIDTIVGKDRLVTDLDLKRLTFLQAIVKETFRLHPPSPLSLPRIASESCEVNGFYIPKGCTLLVDVWAIARDPKMWTNPLMFDPARFLAEGEKPNADVKGNDFEVIPFGAGRRICVGMSLGLRMVQLLVATLIQTFDWELANGLEPAKLNMEEVAYGITLQRAEPLMVHPKAMLAPHVYESC
ncbi:flavonoid 3'-monooxygenase-like [Rutidosis leptorrhynchoides]|uniref:flavonoid 3'-monooxygenase-like n=1 Tax=Rutidosis leptorrhynchoides TaxID=125765 RepID=UPI003A99A006